MCEYLKKLQRPFPAEDIEWRVSHATKGQSGAKALVLAYVTNRAIMERLDEVFGIAGWKNEYQEWREKGVLCTISCKVENEWISKSDGADTTETEATKGGFSASMKRAAVQWGIGRYLYNLEQVWVPVKDRGMNYIKTQTKQREDIKGYWDTPLLPKWALPEGYEAKESKPQEFVPEEDTSLPEPPQSTQPTNQSSYSPAVPTPPTSQPRTPGGSPVARVYKLREELGWEWKDLNRFASETLQREVKFLKKDVTENSDWLKIEQEMTLIKNGAPQSDPWDAPLPEPYPEDALPF